MPVIPTDYAGRAIGLKACNGQMKRAIRWVIVVLVASEKVRFSEVLTND